MHRRPSSRLIYRKSPSQTAGPYVHIGLIPQQAGFDIFETNFSNDIAGPGAEGERIRIEGRIFDGAGHVTKDVLVEIWQANAAGSYNHPADQQDKPLDQGFRGWGRTGTDFVTGLYTIRHHQTGNVVGRKGRKPMAPHVNFWLASRGINIGLPRACISATRGRERRRPCTEHYRAARTPQDPDRSAIRARRRHRLYIRHPSAGRSRDGFLRCLTRFATRPHFGRHYR